MAERAFQYAMRASMVGGQYMRLFLAKGCRMPSIADDSFTARYSNLRANEFMLAA